ncbi:sulfotransferase family 2 domain-containing protein [Aestuariivivens sediminis]|uniref:sulfotransferase family 2 domain-containing protein n=1 Tax=Aestuariivivens sediminis TaxID=2913557 RepID=UPI0023ED4052|nr:sulfotransferase family 2 domain-containing protein [Aestuariivivens sediminis]
MISHKHKCIFIHIPKTGGMSIYTFFNPNTVFYQDVPNYEILFGWCPERQIHMQHATAKQLLDTGLVTKEQWDTYYKFTFVRNPWDRAYSDYLWVQDFANVKGSFKDYLNKCKEFYNIFNDHSNSQYLGDHLLPQSSFFDNKGKYSLDFIGRFENFSEDINQILENIGKAKSFGEHQNKSNRKRDYSLFYSNSNKKLVESKFKMDIDNFGYTFQDNRQGWYSIKKIL